MNHKNPAKPSSKPSDAPKSRRFSNRFYDALSVTQLTAAMIKADGWGLDQYIEAPAWLRDVYDRHADAAHKCMLHVEFAENQPRSK